MGDPNIEKVCRRHWYKVSGHKDWVEDQAVEERLLYSEKTI